MTKTKLAAAAAAVAMVAAADPFEVALWRGETAMVRVPDYTELGEAPDLDLPGWNETIPH